MCVKSFSHYRKSIINYYFFHRNRGARNSSTRCSLNLWDQEVTTEIKLNIEKHWKNEVFTKFSQDPDKKYYYVLPMFPYPSGNLHMGHVRVYSISDTLARFQMLCGKNVVHPIGWDAFGLPAENAAIERSVLPQQWTDSNIETMKEQLLQLGFNFDWDREISTCKPEYYKWTQYIFLKLFEKGLAYQSRANVNWDPVDKTVLADEQVDENGFSWRSGAKVEKKVLTQWFIKTTMYAQKLYDGLNNEYLENWKDIINLQKHWIGECNGVVVGFEMNNPKKKTFDVWTSEPYKFLHAQFVTIKSNSIVLEDFSESDKRNLMCFNPVTNTNIPVYVTDEANYPEERDFYIACPENDEEDLKLAKYLSLDVKITNKVRVDTDGQKAIDIARTKNVGGHFVSSKLKDWLISRQRYWGTPIPIIHCPACGAVPVPYENLPVKLPELDASMSGIQTLAKVNSWTNCKCPKCNLDAQRETDTMDTFVDSSWYYFRFLDPKNENVPFNKENLMGCTPVNIYVGGKEHAVLHLYYARFMSYFLHSLGWTSTEEPFKKLVVQGMVMGQSYKIKSSGKYIPAENVQVIDKQYKEKRTGEPVVVQWEKMSKSKHNGVNPHKLLTEYGCDMTRLLMLADVPPATSRRWSEATLPGVLNWQRRLWMSLGEFLAHRNNKSLYETTSITDKEMQDFEQRIWNSRNYFIATTTYHFQHTQKLSVGISRLQSLTSTLRNKVPADVIAKSKEFEIALASLIIMLAPVTPHFCSELWAGFLSAPNRLCSTHIAWEKGVLHQKWPVVDDHYKLSFQCKVDGADRCDLKIPASELNALSKEKALEIAINEETVAKRITSGILRTKYEYYPGCRAILYIFSNRNIKNKVEVAEAI